MHYILEVMFQFHGWLKADYMFAEVDTHGLKRRIMKSIFMTRGIPEKIIL